MHSLLGRLSGKPNRAFTGSRRRFAMCSNVSKEGALIARDMSTRITLLPPMPGTTLRRLSRCKRAKPTRRIIFWPEFPNATGGWYTAVSGTPSSAHAAELLWIASCGIVESANPSTAPE